MKKILTKNQIVVLEAIGKEKTLRKDFYLTGGTALAAFYLQHRYSEDLDFFSENEVDPLAINVFFKKNKQNLSITKIDFEQSYNRNLFFLYFKGETLKTEFTYFPFKRIENGPKAYQVEIDSLLDIAVNKLFTIYQRSKARDYIDLYVISRVRNFTIADLIKKAKIKFDWHIDPLQLGTQFVKAENVKDYPRLIVDIKPEDWINFFHKEAIKLKKEVLE